jgi:hypothetical protein
MNAVRRDSEQDRANAPMIGRGLVQPPIPPPPFDPWDESDPVDEPGPENNQLNEDADDDAEIEEGILNMAANEAEKKQKLHHLLNDLIAHQTQLVSYDRPTHTV